MTSYILHVPSLHSNEYIEMFCECWKSGLIIYYYYYVGRVLFISDDQTNIAHYFHARIKNFRRELGKWHTIKARLYFYKNNLHNANHNFIINCIVVSESIAACDIATCEKHDKIKEQMTTTKTMGKKARKKRNGTEIKWEAKQRKWKTFIFVVLSDFTYMIPYG